MSDTPHPTDFDLTEDDIRYAHKAIEAVERKCRRCYLIQRAICFLGLPLLVSLITLGEDAEALILVIPGSFLVGLKLSSWLTLCDPPYKAVPQWDSGKNDRLSQYRRALARSQGGAFSWLRSLQY